MQGMGDVLGLQMTATTHYLCLWGPLQVISGGEQRWWDAVHVTWTVLKRGWFDTLPEFLITLLAKFARDFDHNTPELKAR
jgi:hypothetical protein